MITIIKKRSFRKHLLLIVIFSWTVGFVIFLYDLMHMEFHHSDVADAIVVLTGGRGRIQQALDLLRKDKAHKLLITGVNRQVSKFEFTKSLNESLINKITLGYWATNTLENAIEARAWVDEHKIRSLYLVTGNYHMRRAIFEFKLHLEAATILYPLPIDVIRWYEIDIHDLWRLMVEFNKLILAGIRYFLYKKCL